MRRYDGGVSIDGLVDGERTRANSFGTDQAIIVANTLVVEVGTADAPEWAVIGHDGHGWSEVLRVGGIAEFVAEHDRIACDRLLGAAGTEGDVAARIRALGDVPIAVQVDGNLLTIEGMERQVQVPTVANDGVNEVSSSVRRVGESFVCADWSL